MLIRVGTIVLYPPYFLVHLVLVVQASVPAQRCRHGGLHYQTAYALAKKTCLRRCS